MRIKRMLAIVAVVLIATLLTGCAGGEDESDDADMQNKLPLVVGINGNSPPMAYKNRAGNTVGFDVDLLTEVANRLGREVKFNNIDWNDKDVLLKNGKVDMLASGFDITAKRKEIMIFTKPYMDNRQLIFVKKGNNTITNKQGLSGKNVGAQSSSTTYEYISDSPFFQSKVKAIKKYENLVQALLDLDNGKVDAVIGDEVMGRYYISEHPEKVDVINVVIGTPTSFGIGFAKDNQKLRDEVQNAIDEIKADGTMAEISNKWFGKDVTK